MILVLGARGVLGNRVAQRLMAVGKRVRLLSRAPASLAAMADAGAEVVKGDLLEEDWLEKALAGVGSVVIASHGLYPPSRSNHPGAVDGEGARKLIDAAVHAGVRRVVYLSAAGAGAASPRFFSIKYATEQHIRASGVVWTIVRPTVFIENNALVLLGEPLRSGGVVRFIGPGTTRVNWVSADDVAEVVVRSLDDPTTAAQVIEVRGPDELSRIECLEILERALGRKARRSHLPRGVARMVRALASPWHPGLAGLIELALADPGVPPEPADALVLVGGTRVTEVAERWARQAQH